MADLTTVSNSSASSNDDYTVLTDEVTDATLGTGKKQLIGIMDATVDGTNKASVSAAGALKVDGSAVTQPVSDGGSTLSVDDGGSTLSVDDGGGSLTVDGTVAVSGTVAVTDNSGSLTVDNGGTFAVQDSEKVADNAAFTDGTTKVLPSGYVFDEVAGTALTENDAAAARVDSKRAQVLVIEDETTRGRRATVTAANALKVDASDTTQPISATSLPLPSGAATAAKQPALGTAGTPSADVISVQGVASGTDLPVSVSSMPAAASTTDSISAKIATDKIMNNLTELTPKFAKIDNATSGDNTLVAAVTSKKIRVLAAFLVASAAVNVRFESGAGGTALTGQMNVGANGGFVLPFNPVGWFETAVTTLLNLELSGATSVDGCLVYVEV